MTIAVEMGRKALKQKKTTFCTLRAHCVRNKEAQRSTLLNDILIKLEYWTFNSWSYSNKTANLVHVHEEYMYIWALSEEN